MSSAFDDLHRFDSVDATGDAARFVRFLERVDAQPHVQVRRRRSYDLLWLTAGDRVVDVGCGTGTVLGELGELGVQATGVDASAEMVARVRERVPGAMVLHGDAEALPLPDASMAGYRAERVYQHLHDARAALGEARRVLRPGGRVVLVDQDWDALVIDSDDAPATRAVVRAFSDSLVDGRAGLKHRARLIDAGFQEVEVEAETVALADSESMELIVGTVAQQASNALGAEAVQEWLAEQRRRADSGRFLALMTHVIASATR